MGDYRAMVLLEEGACIPYTAAFSGEQEIHFVRAELPIQVTALPVDDVVRISWNAVPGVRYCVQAKADLSLSARKRSISTALSRPALCPC